MAKVYLLYLFVHLTYVALRFPGFQAFVRARLRVGMHSLKISHHRYILYQAVLAQGLMKDCKQHVLLEHFLLQVTLHSIRQSLIIICAAPEGSIPPVGQTMLDLTQIPYQNIINGRIVTVAQRHQLVCPACGFIFKGAFYR